MAIQQLHIYGYRSFKDAVWRPGKLNLLVGQNASGKSNLLRLLELISLVAKGRLNETLTTGDGIVPLLWNHKATRFGWDLRLEPLDLNSEQAGFPLAYQFAVDSNPDRVGFRIRTDRLCVPDKNECPGNEMPFLLGRGRRAFVFRPATGGMERFEDFDRVESLLSQIDAHMNQLSARYRRHMESWRIYHEIHTERGSQMRSPVVTQTATRVESDGRNFAAVLHTLYTGNREFRRQIDDGMRAAFGEDFEDLRFVPAAKQQIQLGIQWKSCQDPHTGQELSDGTLRFLFLLTVLSVPDPPALIAIDEPEVGLHPRMLPLIAEYAAAAAERTQVVISTHSPEFLDHFTEAQPDVTIFNWDAGETQLHQLPPDRLAKWLDEYRLGRMFTSGELDALIEPDLEPLADIEDRLEGFPPEGETVPAGEEPDEGDSRG